MYSASRFILIRNLALKAGSSKQGKALRAARGSNWVAAKTLTKEQVRNKQVTPTGTTNNDDDDGNGGGDNKEEEQNNLVYLLFPLVSV